MKQTELMILMGGKSAEHGVSLISAKNIYAGLNKEKYNITLVGIDKNGQWYLLNNEDFLNNPENPDTVSLKLTNNKIAISFGEKKIIDLSGEKEIPNPDVVFPVLHGTFGEDGTMQGLLDILDVAYVGPDVLGSAVAMDKDTAKRLLTHANIPNAKFISFTKSLKKISYKDVIDNLGEVVFVKPSNCGSSVGVHKVKSEEQFKKAIDDAFRYDDKILVEEYIQGREIECSIFGDAELTVSLPGEVIPKHEFYSYEAKYIDEDGAGLKVPAELDKNTVARIQEMTKDVFRTLNLNGMARVDFFLKNDGKLIVNEVNTIPGFTKISMYPKLFMVSGLEYSILLDNLIDLAQKRFNTKKTIKFTC